MTRETHPIEVLLGRDGSWVIEGVEGGQTVARRILQVLLGTDPPVNSYRTNAVWNWLYFPPGSLTPEQRTRIIGTGQAGSQPWTWRVREVAHVEEPGHFNESQFEVLKEPKTGKVVAGLLAFGLLVATGLFWINGRQPGPVSADLAAVLAAARTPYEAPTFGDRLATQFTDGDRFEVPITANDIIHRGNDVIILAGPAGMAYFIQAEEIGATLAGELQSPGSSLGFDTRGGSARIASRKLDGSWVAATVIPLTVGVVEPGLDPAGIRFDDAKSFELGKRYAFAGGVEVQGGDFVVFALPRIVPPYRVAVQTADPGLAALLGYIAAHNYTVVVTGTLATVEAEAARTSTKIIGHVGPDLGIQAFRSSFVPAKPA